MMSPIKYEKRVIRSVEKVRVISIYDTTASGRGKQGARRAPHAAFTHPVDDRDVVTYHAAIFKNLPLGINNEGTVWLRNWP
jgi:hypothetical protein